MSNRINKISLALLVSLLGATAAWASDVYIDQAGSTTTIDITQTVRATLLVVAEQQVPSLVVTLILMSHKQVPATQLTLKQQQVQAIPKLIILQLVEATY